MRICRPERAPFRLLRRVKQAAKALNRFLQDRNIFNEELSPNIYIATQLKRQGGKPIFPASSSVQSHALELKILLEDMYSRFRYFSVEKDDRGEESVDCSVAVDKFVPRLTNQKETTAALFMYA